MNADAYYMTAQDKLLGHGDVRQHTSLLKDWGDSDAPDSPTEINALVASDDCFITLATTIESVMHALTVDKPTASPQLEKLVATLLYLQRHFRIHRKSPDHRQ